MRPFNKGEIHMINTNKVTNNEPSISASTGRSEKFHEATKRLSDYLYSLNLSPEENGTLIHLLLDEILTAEHDAFLHGLLPSLIHAARLGSLDETATNNEKAIKAKSVANSYEYGFGVARTWPYRERPWMRTTCLSRVTMTVDSRTGTVWAATCSTATT